MLKGMQTTVKSSTYALFRAHCPVVASLSITTPCLGIVNCFTNLEVSRE